jgi:hypothetical protein
MNIDGGVRHPSTDQMPSTDVEQSTKFGWLMEQVLWGHYPLEYSEGSVLDIHTKRIVQINTSHRRLGSQRRFRNVPDAPRDVYI